MKININKFGHGYSADCLDLPGSPPVGHGSTPEMALAALFYQILFDNTGGMNPKSWSSYIKRDDPIVINSVVWSYPN